MSTIRRILSRASLLLLATALPATSGGAQALHELKLLAQDGAADDSLGFSASVDGGLALVAAYRDGNQAGAAYLFDAYTGQQLFKLTPQDPESYDYFGWSVSLSGDRVLVGAPYDDGLATQSGSAYIFSVLTGQQLFKLLPQVGAYQDRFGRSVSVSGDRALVGSQGDDEVAQEAGAAFVFDVNTGQELIKLTASDAVIWDHLGNSVSLRGDLALVGAVGVAGGRGAAYLFDVTTGQQLHKLTASDGLPFDEFGCSVSLGESLALVGAQYDDESYDDVGSAYVFDIATGQELHKLTAPDAQEDDHFGVRVSLAGGRALIGAPRDDDRGPISGSSYLFDAASGQLLDKWIAQGVATGDFFGWGLAISDELALVGAIGDDDMADGAGCAYVLRLNWPGTGYCFGDAGSGTPCPCSNDNDGSVPGSGCANGVHASGALLIGDGAASLAGDTLVLSCTGLETGNAGLYFQANNDRSPGVVWGDGLSCAGGSLKRLQLRVADSSGASFTTIGISAKAGNIAPGDTRYYQCWYRNPTGSPCGAEFNASNAGLLT